MPFPGYDCTDNMGLHGFNNKKVENVATRSECIQLCRHECAFDCLSIDYRESDNRCTLSSESKFTQPSEFKQSNVLSYCTVNASRK